MPIIRKVIVTDEYLKNISIWMQVLGGIFSVKEKVWFVSLPTPASLGRRCLSMKYLGYIISEIVWINEGNYWPYERNIIDFSPTKQFRQPTVHYSSAPPNSVFCLRVDAHSHKDEICNNSTVMQVYCHHSRQSQHSRVREATTLTPTPTSWALSTGLQLKTISRASRCESKEESGHNLQVGHI